MVNQQTVEDSIHDAVSEIRATRGVVECAVISRDGTLIDMNLRDEVPASAFAAISASMLASAEAATNLLSLPEPSHLVAYSRDVLLLVIGAGDRMLVSATVDRQTDISPVFERLHEIASKMGGEVIP
jgi:predicted regulator of Ras-like GTPase activity (Roadblock/LC7/MglB family)